jgi:hypothetical protein
MYSASLRQALCKVPVSMSIQEASLRDAWSLCRAVMEPLSDGMVVMYHQSVLHKMNAGLICCIATGVGLWGVIQLVEVASPANATSALRTRLVIMLGCSFFSL